MRPAGQRYRGLGPFTLAAGSSGSRGGWRPDHRSFVARLPIWAIEKADDRGCHTTGMSYDLLIWEGDRPASDAVALQHFKDTIARMRTEDPVPPTPSIRSFVESLLAPEFDDPSTLAEEIAWVLKTAHGPSLLLNMPWRHAKDMSAAAAELAHDQALNCYDPQMTRQRP